MKVNFAKAKLLSATMLLAASTSAFSGYGPGDSTSPPPIARAAAATATAETYTYTTCYFIDNKDNKDIITWNWGLKSDNGWYRLTGHWVKTPYTKVEKFSTATTYDSIYQSCMNSQKYYKVGGQLFAIFAADSGSGHNYPILVGGGDLFPNY